MRQINNSSKKTICCDLNKKQTETFVVQAKRLAIQSFYLKNESLRLVIESFYLVGESFCDNVESFTFKNDSFILDGECKRVVFQIRNDKLFLFRNSFASLSYKSLAKIVINGFCRSNSFIGSFFGRSVIEQGRD